MFAGEARAAGGAFVVDDAAVDEPGACKVESSASFAGNRDFLGLADAGLRGFVVPAGRARHESPCVRDRTENGAAPPAQRPR